jgi:hypothetical protein
MFGRAHIDAFRACSFSRRIRSTAASHLDSCRGPIVRYNPPSNRLNVNMVVGFVWKTGALLST